MTPATQAARQAARLPAAPAIERPFGTLREQAAMQQRWLRERLDTFLPALMRKHGIDMWVVPMREYTEDPGLQGDHRARDVRGAPAHDLRVLRQVRGRPADAAAPAAWSASRSAEHSQGGVFEARRSTKPAAGDVGRGQQAELWGDEQWQALKTVIEERNPRVIGINRSTVFAFSDGLSSGELKGMSAALGDEWTSKFKDAEGLPLELIAVAPAGGGSVLPPDAGARLVDDADDVLVEGDHAGQDAHERPGVVVAAARQRSRPRHLVPAERRRAAQGRDRRAARATIRSSSAATCSTATSASPSRASTPTRSTTPTCCGPARPTRRRPARALANANALQDIVMEEIAPGPHRQRDPGASRARMKAKKIDGTVYSHPIGLHGHGAGPLIGLWDYQDGVPGRGDAKVIPSMWFSIELQATTPRRPEWDNQPVRMAQEEDAIIDADGKIRWALKRQDRLFLVK